MSRLRRSSILAPVFEIMVCAPSAVATGAPAEHGVGTASATTEPPSTSPADRLPPGSWVNSQWVDPGGCKTLDVTKYLGKQDKSPAANRSRPLQ